MNDFQLLGRCENDLLRCFSALRSSPLHPVLLHCHRHPRPPFNPLQTRTRHLLSTSRLPLLVLPRRASQKPGTSLVSELHRSCHLIQGRSTSASSRRRSIVQLAHQHASQYCSRLIYQIKFKEESFSVQVRLRCRLTLV